MVWFNDFLRKEKYSWFLWTFIIAKIKKKKAIDIRFQFFSKIIMKEKKGKMYFLFVHNKYKELNELLICV